ncbi:MAG: hypothetical protein PF549_00360, partial [Patescibacteria group bacterium]|nr:hypothetical protein [Patescibacteria group bacterium]
ILPTGKECYHFLVPTVLFLENKTKCFQAKTKGVFLVRKTPFLFLVLHDWHLRVIFFSCFYIKEFLIFLTRKKKTTMRSARSINRPIVLIRDFLFLSIIAGLFFGWRFCFFFEVKGHYLRPIP